MKKINQLHDQTPLVVDLDGTFLNTDVFIEAIIKLINKHGINIFYCIGWLFKGIPYLKKKVFEKVHVNYKTLPVNMELLEFLKSESEKDRKIILATASPKSVAIEIGHVYPIFNEIYGTEKDVNLKGQKKRELLISLFGEKGYDYIGNSTTDVAVFSSARYAYLVNPSWHVKSKTKKVSSLQKSWKTNKNTLLSYLKLIRIYQWVKNLLLFLPIITSHSFHSLHLFGQVFLAFFAFGFISSAGYIGNDIMDMETDRTHPRKRSRALASGNISIFLSILLSVFFLITGLGIGFLLNIQFFFLLILYFLLSMTYSVLLKKYALYDVFILASFYTLRVIAGGVVSSIPISFWLISFSIFIFLSLSFVKRYSEVFQINTSDHSSRRGYTQVDIPLLQIMGIVCGLISVVVFSLYINSPEVVLLYSKPHILWIVSLLLLFWVSQVWLITSRGKMTDDPIVFMMKDPFSFILLLFTSLTLFYAI